ncbi:hypothetical protein MWN34_07075 [Ancylobacter sp. 6x-1]|uniref:Lipoprotein n=1 Tax=Ancylobacter crimeensis TaxID=2579147 RepID=A0ABT0D9Q0_9HYPH|nr:hypothetical protein [Ancylobacter crimeensis]MCK0196675.1 hypothetical protein [Ancylobacter crimeensis]
MTILSRGLVIPVCVVLSAFALAGCQTTGGPVASADAPRATNMSAGPTAAGAPAGNTVAFESIDGPPQPVFTKLVSSLNSEAGSHRVQIVSRDEPATYRVRGYLAASVENGKGTVDWAWDVFDDAERTRVMRISGSEPVASGDVWDELDQNQLDRIAAQSMDELSRRLSGTAVASAEPAAPAEAETPPTEGESAAPAAEDAATSPATAANDEAAPAAPTRATPAGTTTRASTTRAARSASAATGGNGYASLASTGGNLAFAPEHE